MIQSSILIASVSRRAGGLFESVRRLGQSLLEGGVGVEVFSCKDNFTDEDLYAWQPIKPHVFQSVWPYSFSYAPGFAAALSRSKIDIVHLHGIWMYPSAACTSWTRKTRLPHIVSPHGMLDPWAIRNSHWKKIIAAFFFENKNMKEAACMRALCESEMVSMRKYGLKNPICVIPNGIDLPTQRTLITPRWKSGNVADRKVLLYLGRIHPKKGLSQLLQGWAMMQRQDMGFIRDWVLVIAGWDQLGHEAELKKLSSDLQIVDSVGFIGPQFNENKLAAYQNADAFVLPSFSEGLPMVTLEAWVHKLPVLLTPECNLPEGFSSRSAIQISTEPEAIAKGLYQLFSMSHEERVEMGGRGFRLVEERFTWPKIAADMKTVYEWTLGGGNPPSCVMRN